MWWLAAHAAAGTLGPELGELNGLVPFVLPLRTLRARGAALPTPAELPAVARLPVDAPPDGWAGRILKAGRALLLVDGLDEVPQGDREAAHAWLSASICGGCRFGSPPRRSCRILSGLREARSILVSGPFTDDDLSVALRGHPVDHLQIENNDLLTDLAVTRACHRLGVLTVGHCPALPADALASVADSVHSVHLTGVRVSNSGLAALARLPELRSLVIENPVLENEKLSLKPFRRLPDLGTRVTGLGKSRITGREAIAGTLTID